MIACLVAVGVRVCTKPSHTRDVKNGSYCSLGPQTGATHCRTKLVLTDKGRAFKELVVCRVLLN